MDWLPENLFAFATGLAGAGVFHFLASRITLPVEDPFYPLYAEQFAYFPGATVLILVVLTPIVEEVLFRGLMFGSLRKYSRSLGYVVSILVYAFYAAQQYAFTPGNVDLRYLLLMVRYLPMAAALTWSYDNGGSVWTPIFLRMALNGFQLFAAVNGFAR